MVTSPCSVPQPFPNSSIFPQLMEEWIKYKYTHLQATSPLKLKRQNSRGKEKGIQNPKNLQEREMESSLKSAALLEQMKKHLETDAGKELKERVGLVYQLNIAPKKIGFNEEIFVVDLKQGKVSKGPYDGKPDATFSFTDDNFLSIATGKMNPQIAFIRGNMKIKGSISAAQKFTPDIFPKPSKL
ncbi:hypothetical protein LUZ63_008265 [Rhynchospora breviuscula]|uniref:SCP2 domain-containing protein n=1 Tax=Rhynchospora breviuscula TaxID=2022672 RepID=A0A9Q0CTL4_9POAL|nr:hypothetical protein LUZ63_008265 [Rhynchospora breviuscula]